MQQVIDKPLPELGVSSETPVFSMPLQGAQIEVLTYGTKDGTVVVAIINESGNVIVNLLFAREQDAIDLLNQAMASLKGVEVELSSN